MTKEKDTLRNILNSVGQGNLTNEDIQAGQSILDSSIILLPQSNYARVSPTIILSEDVLDMPIPIDEY